MTFNEQAYINSLITQGCIGFFIEPITLASGEKSNWYADMRRKLIAGDNYDFEKLDEYATFVADFAEMKGIKSPLMGVPEAATLPAIMANEKLGRNFSYLRQTLKSHGVPGKFPYSLSPIGVAGKEFAVLEDTLTTGDSAIKTILNLYEGGAKVTDVIVSCYREDRRWGGMMPHEYIEKHLGIPVHFMTKASNIMPIAIKELKPDAKVIEGLKKEYSTHQQMIEILNNSLTPQKI